jgi:hypothetical protein
VALLALAGGLCALAVAAAGVASQVLPRRFSVAQQHQIEKWEVARRWRTLPASAIFPATVAYRLPAGILNSAAGLTLSARRLGVSDPQQCAAGAGQTAARILHRYHCTALLRATYADSTGSMVATVGVAVLPDNADAAQAQYRLALAGRGGQPDSVQAARVPGTLAEGFGARQQQMSMNTHAGPYVILATVGYADGRPRVRVAADAYLDQEMNSLVTGLDDAVSGELGQPAKVPSCPGAPGC